MKQIRVLLLIVCVLVNVAALSFVAVVHTGAPARIESQAPALLPAIASPSIPFQEPERSHAPTPIATPVVHAGRYSLPLSSSAPMINRLKIRERTVFVTIDDGNYRDPRVLDLLRETHLPVSAFLVGRAVNVKPAYWQAMSNAGVRVEDHTRTHARLKGLSFSAQRSEICSPVARYRKLFGKSPTLFRPPYGSYDATTLRAARACGMTAVVNWSATFGGGVLKTWSGKTLRPGDIVLMHFKPSLHADLLSLMRILKEQNLGVGLLESYLQPAPRRSPPPPPSPSPSPGILPAAPPKPASSRS